MNTQLNNYQLNIGDTTFAQITNLTSLNTIEFNGISLLDICDGWSGIGITKANLFDVTNIDIVSYVSDQIDGGWVINKKYGNRTLSLTLMIQGDDYDDLIDRIDTLKKNTSAVEADFNIIINWETRTYSATCTSIRFPNFKKWQDYIDEVDIDFLITSPQWYVKTEESILVDGIVADFNKTIENTGTYQSYPKVLFVMKNSWNALTGISLTLTSVSETSGYEISISETVDDGDFVVFDYREKTVTINGVEVQFDGVMTPMETGYSTFAVVFTGTVNCDVYFNYNKTYL
jgi:hypothetical protein